MAEAIHVSRKKGKGSAHSVGVADLRVMITCDGPSEWYAQGLEIDYIAQGVDLEDVKRSFEQGLAKTIEENLKCLGDIQRMLTPAPQEVWQTYYSNVRNFKYTHVSSHEFPNISCNDGVLVAHTRSNRGTSRKAACPTRDRVALPFVGIAYMQQQQAG